MAKKLGKMLILFPENGKFIPLYIREIYVTYKKNHTTSVLFIFQGATPVPSSVSVLGDEEKKKLSFVNWHQEMGIYCILKAPIFIRILRQKIH